MQVFQRTFIYGFTQVLGQGRPLVRSVTKSRRRVWKCRAVLNAMGFLAALSTGVSNPLLAATLNGSATIPHPASFYPDIPNFNSQRLNQQLQLYRQYIVTVGVPDILIVGSSRSLQGIDPTVLQEALARRGYPDLRVYNFGINGATAQVVDLIVRQVLLPEQLPRVLIWGDGLRAFNNGREDLTYSAILSSAGYQAIVRGHHPIPIYRDAASPLIETPQCLEPPPLSMKRIPLRSRNLECFPSERLNAQQENEEILSLSRLRPLADLDALGFRQVTSQFQPSLYYQQFPRIPGNYDGDYVPFQLQGAQQEATRRIARYARQHRVELIFVSLPLSREHMDGVRQRYEQIFRQQMQAIAQAEGFLWRDWSQRWATENQYFADPSHLNQYGAAAVAEAIATDPAFRWEEILKE